MLFEVIVLLFVFRSGSANLEYTDYFSHKTHHSMTSQETYHLLICHKTYHPMICHKAYDDMYMYFLFQTVIPLNEECGLIEWVSNTAGLRPILHKIYR